MIDYFDLTMLFYSQIRKEFSPAAWRTGQKVFADKLLTNVRMEKEKLWARIFSPYGGTPHDVQVIVARGTIIESICSCRPGIKIRRPEKHCEHAASLCIWVVERGSLLRAGIDAPDEGTSPEPVEEKKIYVEADPVLWVRGLFENKILQAVSVEPAVRFKDTETGEVHIKPTQWLTKHPSELRTWKTPLGIYLRLSRESIPVLETIETTKVVYQGRAALEQLARLLTHGGRSQIVFHEDIDLEVDDEPLRLKSMHVGAQAQNNRVVSFLFENPTLKISSQELSQLAALGRVSDHYVWKGRILYRFAISLLQIYQFANRSGVAALELGGEEAQKIVHTGFAYLHDDQDYPLHPLAVYRLSLELGVEDFSVDDEWREFQEWKKNFEKKKIAALPEVEYGFDLRDYQVNGLTWMWSLYHRGLSALLADDMGLGKTHQVLAYLSSVYATKPGEPVDETRKTTKNKDKVAPTLVVAPTSVVAAWKQKLEKYPTGLKYYVFHGNTRSMPTANVDIILTTYGILQREASLRDKRWEVVVMDEAQAIKNATTISSRAARTLKCRFRIAMTGTPVENQASDLWSIMEFLLPGYLGSLPRFKRLYGSGREIPTLEQAQALKRLVTPFLLRRTKSQVLKELPEKTEEVVLCEPTAAQKKAYRDILESSEAERARKELETDQKKVNYANILAVLTRLKQVCDHPRLPEYTGGKVKKIENLKPEDTGKWETFDELLNEALRSDLKVVIFTQYLGMMDFIAHHLKNHNIGYTELRGDTQDRAARMDRFAADPECKIFLCSLLAGGLGIDLTAGSVCIHFDRWWNPAKENQATDRLHRLGQTRGVQVFKLQIQGTVEDRIAQIIESKKELSNALIEESPLALRAFSRQDLLDLLRIPDSM